MIKKNIDINDINCSITCFKAYLSLGNCYNNIKLKPYTGVRI